MTAWTDAPEIADALRWAEDQVEQRMLASAQAPYSGYAGIGASPAELAKVVLAAAWPHLEAYWRRTIATEGDG